MSSTDELGFHPDALRKRYRQERERRLRDDGIEQYVEIARDHAGFARDPWAEPGFGRAPTEYADILAAWREDGDLDGLDIHRQEVHR